MEKSIPTQLENSEEIKDALRVFKCNKYVHDGYTIKSVLMHVKFSNNEYDLNHLFAVVKRSIITHFVFSYNEITERMGIKTEDDMAERLFTKAVRWLTKTTAKGELGELLLFTVLDVHVGAPKILNKIQHKTALKSPAHGADAVHAQFVNGDFVLYLGESKLHKNVSNAFSKAVSSISNQRKGYKSDYVLMDSYIDYKGITQESKEKILKVLDPFEDSSTWEEKVKVPCFIGFGREKLLQLNEESFYEEYDNLAAKLEKNFFSALNKKLDNPPRTILILLPFKSVEELTKKFISAMGIKDE